MYCITLYICKVIILCKNVNGTRYFTRISRFNNAYSFRDRSFVIWSRDSFICQSIGILDFRGCRFSFRCVCLSSFPSRKRDRHCKKSTIDLLSRSNGLSLSILTNICLIPLTYANYFFSPLLLRLKGKNDPCDREITKLLGYRIFFSAGKKKKNKESSDSPNYKIVRLIQLNGSN